MMINMPLTPGAINLSDALKKLLMDTGFANINLKIVAMIAISCFLLYLAIVKKFEPLLLMPIAFGMLLVNLPGANLMADPIYVLPDDITGLDFIKAYSSVKVGQTGGFIYYLYQGVKLGIYPSLIFLAIGAMSDFGPLIANPTSLLLGAAAQGGIFLTFILAKNINVFVPSVSFSFEQAASIGIIGGADGPTAIYLTNMLAPELLGAIAIAAYSYMALVPFIQPPIMKLFTTKKEREIMMQQLRPVSKTEKIVFPIAVAIIVILLLPSTAPLIGCLMLGNLLRESGVVDRLSNTAQNELCNIVTIMLGVSVGATASAENFLRPETILIVIMGLLAFSFSTMCGVLFGKVMCWATKGKVNPLIGSAGVSAVPMAARVSQKVGQEANPKNFLLMHAMGPNVAGVIGSAVAAGVFISLFG